MKMVTTESDASSGRSSPDDEPSPENANAIPESPKGGAKGSSEKPSSSGNEGSEDDDTGGEESPNKPHDGSSGDLAPYAPTMGEKQEDEEKEVARKIPYRDYSRDAPPAPEFGRGAAKGKGKDPTFPVKLHMILSNPEFQDIITWLPHGRSWRILQQRAFEERVIPVFFRHGRYSSFARQVNGWGFKRVTHGSDYNSYYHEMFLRGLPHLCHRMRRLTSKDVAKRRESAEALGEEAEFTPDFYEMSRLNPLPENPMLPTMARGSLFGANPLLGALNPGLAGIHPALLAANPALLASLEASLIERQHQQRAELIQRLSALEAQQQSNPGISPQLAQLLRSQGFGQSLGQTGQGASGDSSMQNSALASLLLQQQQQGQAGMPPNVGGLGSLRNSLGGGAAGMPQSALSSNPAGASAAPATAAGNTRSLEAELLAARASAGGNPDLSMLLALQAQQQAQQQAGGFGGLNGGMYGGGM